MNKTYKTQAIVLLSIGLLLSPAIYILLSLVALGSLGELLAYAIYLLPAFVSIMCITFGIGRLLLAKRQPTTPSTQNTATATQTITAKEYRQKRSDLTALTIGTVLLSVIGIAMLLFIVNSLQQADELFVLIYPGAVPILILLFAVVMVPINIKKILKQKKIISVQQEDVIPKDSQRAFASLRIISGQ